MVAGAADIGVIGGSGFYRFLPGLEEVVVHTPYGPTSAPLAVGEVGGRRVAFLPRHGTRHEFPPHRVNYRANIWALHQLGVRRLFGPCAAGSLSPDIHPGDLVVLDQLVDRTSGRPDTFLDGPVVGHVGFADPYCPELAWVVTAAAGAPDRPAVHRGGTVVVVQGPRFSTRAESRWFRQAGWQVVNMTQYPEAYLARELGMCYCGIALITDYDTGAAPDASGEPVTMQAVVEVLDRAVAATRDLLLEALAAVPDPPGCRCSAGADPGPFAPGEHAGS